jgi:hypothetical protein
MVLIKTRDPPNTGLDCLSIKFLNFKVWIVKILYTLKFIKNSAQVTNNFSKIQQSKKNCPKDLLKVIVFQGNKSWICHI